MESAPKGRWGLGLKRPKLRLAGPLLSQRADDARQATGWGAQTDVGLRRGDRLIQGHTRLGAAGALTSTVVDLLDARHMPF